MHSIAEAKFHADLVTGPTQGLKNSAHIVAEALAEDFSSKIHVARQRNLYLANRQIPRAVGALFGVKRLTVMFEIIPPFWYRMPNASVFVPNQEFLNRDAFDRVGKCSEVWCKTHYAEALLIKEHFTTQFVGFTGHDIYLPDVRTDYSRCIHVAGRSHLKGTRQLLRLWQRHPEWPELLVVTQQPAFLNFVAPNIRFFSSFLSDLELHRLMNQCGIHLCTSEAEGYGHYISEALSAKAVVVTTNAPPMNELVLETFGVLVDADEHGPMGIGSVFKTRDDDLEKKIEQVFSLPLETKAAMGELARTHFIRNKQEFRNRITVMARRLMGN